MAPAANPLVDAANPLLNAISQIRQSATHANPAQLRQQLIDEMRRFEIRGQRANRRCGRRFGGRRHGAGDRRWRRFRHGDRFR